jgi:hypothetical protein
MKNALASALLLILIGVSSSASLSQNPADTALIKAYIAKQVKQEGGDEYEDARKVIEGDLNNDNTADLAVLYTIEGQHGTNNYVQYLAVFLRVNGKLVLVTRTVVGGKSRRSVELESVDKGVIHLTTLSYTVKDAACCPSKKGKTRYTLVNRRLKEL